MNVGIIGAGNVGCTLAVKWAVAGHSVLIGSRNPKARDRDRLAMHGAIMVSPQEAVRQSDVVVLAIPWPAVYEVLSTLPFAGKIIIDATNPFAPDLSGLALGGDTSAAEQIAERAKNARVVKALNTVGFNVMEDPRFPEGNAVMFYCGDDAEAKRVAHRLVVDLGFDAQDAGPLTHARQLESLAMLWITLAIQCGYGTQFGFKLLRR